MSCCWKSSAWSLPVSPGISKARLLPAAWRQMRGGCGRALVGWWACLCCEGVLLGACSSAGWTGAVPAGCSLLPLLVFCKPDFLRSHICFPHLLPPAPARVWWSCWVRSQLCSAICGCPPSWDLQCWWVGNGDCAPYANSLHWAGQDGEARVQEHSFGFPWMSVLLRIPASWSVCMKRLKKSNKFIG